jgi:lipid-A-disaccharide synthase
LPPHRDPPPPELRFPSRAPVIGLLPGSRKSVAAANFPGLLEVAAHVRREFPSASFVVPTTTATQPAVAAALRTTVAHGFEEVTTVRQDAFDDLVPECDLCLTVSGTATLHVAGHNVPMIVVYHGNPVLWHAIGRWLIKVRTRTLVNLLAAGPDAAAERHVTPEFTPWYGRAGIDAAANLAVDYLRHPEKLEAQRAKLAELVRSLDKPGASLNAARVALGLMRGAPAQPGGAGSQNSVGTPAAAR